MNNQLDLAPFHFNQGSIMLPASWQDTSILVLNSTDEKMAPVSPSPVTICHGGWHSVSLPSGK
ncbi:hypothetical protein Xvie_01449 [Xenorhabdus vietnamensis]|uniref:Uncharacterized protein n=1 Tax=Xenorhabdus vietnamensis TaxID=351656 RepID=A0A1Y2SGS6_9GAMM|nr:hypothetical protein [Xenorhabdus vietnamensis]OTA16771.1 hypothetical protein Xvie_01449 [Xenorhabdus vietnamensis]